MSGPLRDGLPLLPGRLRLTPCGAGLLLLSLTAFVLSLLTSLAELRALALSLALGLAAALATTLPTRRRRIDLVAEGPRALPGTQVHLHLAARNRGRRGAAAVDLELPLGEERTPVRVTVPPLAPGERDVQAIPVLAERRGVLTPGPLHEVREDGLGLWRHTRRHGPRVTMPVAPRSLRLDPLPGRSFELRWAPARVGPPTGSELALEVVHSLARRRVAGARSLRVRLPGLSQPVTCLPALQDALARWRPVPGADGAAPACPREPASIVVTGPGAGLATLLDWGRAGCLLVIRCTADGPTRIHHLEGLLVLDLARLEDLPRALSLPGPRRRFAASRTPPRDHSASVAA